MTLWIFFLKVNNWHIFLNYVIKSVSFLQGNCYKKIGKETKEIQGEILKKLGSGPIEQDVIVLYEGETLPDQVCGVYHESIRSINKSRNIVQPLKRRLHCVIQNEQ